MTDHAELNSRVHPHSRAALATLIGPKRTQERWRGGKREGRGEKGEERMMGIQVHDAYDTMTLCPFVGHV